MPRKLKPIVPTPLEISQDMTGDPYLTTSTKDILVDPNTVRGNQTSLANSNWKDLSIGIEDIDNSIKYYFEKVIKPFVMDNSQRVDVPIIYGSPERWRSVQVDGYYRDALGKIMAPLIMFKRNNIEKNRQLGNKLDGNISHLYQIFESKFNKKNVYDKFSVLTNRIPSKQYYLSIVPDYVTITYECMLFVDYVEHANKIIESINFASDSYWGDASKFQFRAKIDNFNSTVELNNGVDRAVRTSFNIVLNGYIIADNVNEKLATQNLIYSPAQIVVGLETVESDMKMNSLGRNLNSTNSPKYTFVNDNTISGGSQGGSSSVDTLTLVYLFTNSTFKADTIVAPNTANFSNRNIVSVPTGLPTPSATNGGFSFFVNGQYVPPLAIISFSQITTYLSLVLDTSILGYILDSADEVIVIGKIQ